jgi:prepilin signal peptidase PulO-like enzyme (type II secretory pathway)
MYYFFLFICGSAIGSFLNVLIDRIPADESIGGRSKCDYCGKILRVSDLVPVLSFLRLGGKTSCCGKKLSVYYPFVEALTGVLFVLVGSYGDFDLALLIMHLGVVSALIVIFFADIKYRIIPDVMILALLFFATPILFIQSGGDVSLIVTRLFGGLVLFAGMLAIYVATRGKGMGFGDVKFAFALGYLLGLKMGFFAIYIAFIIGGVVAAGLLLHENVPSRERKRGVWTLKSKIAFGPFLVAGMIITYVFEHGILAIVEKLL